MEVSGKTNNGSSIRKTKKWKYQGRQRMEVSRKTKNGSIR